MITLIRIVVGLVVVVVMGLGAAVASATPAYWVIAFDHSRSMAQAMEVMKASAIELVRRIPAGDTLTVLEVGSVVRPVRTIEMTEAARGLVIDDLTGMKASASNTDLGLALVTSGSLATLSPSASKHVFIFTDAVPRPRRGSPFAGRSLDALLGDPAVVPSGTEVTFVLPPGVAAPSTALSHVKFIGPSELPVPPPPVPVEAAAPPPASRSVTSWALAAGGVASIGLLAVAGFRRVFRRRDGESEDDQLALAETPPPIVETADAPEPPAEKVAGFIIRGDRDVVLHAGTPALDVGDQWNAALFLPGAAGAAARLSLTPRGRLQVTNIGSAAVLAGALPIVAGATRVLPLGVIALRLGGETLTIMPSSDIKVNEE